MRSSKTLMMLGSALLLGGVAAYLTVDWINSQVSTQVAGKTRVQMSKVTIAAADVRAGKELLASDLTLVEWPTTTLPAGAVADPAALVGRVVRNSLLKGEPIIESRLAVKGARGGISSLIAPGKRAISIAVNDSVGMASYSLEGSFVDVIVNSSETSEGERQRSMSKIVLERVHVLGVSNAPGSEGRIGAVMLEVTPGEAESLDLARSIGTLSLAMRNQQEDHDTKTRGATRESLFGLAPRPQAPVVAMAQPTFVASAPVAMPAPAPRPAAPREAVREVVKAEPTPPVLAKAASSRTCVDALIGTERRSECF